MNKIKEFKEIMEINDLNKNAVDEDEDKNSAKGSAEGDTETVSEEEDEEVKADVQESMNMVKKNSAARVSLRKEKTLKSKSKKGLSDLIKDDDEDSSEVDEGDEGANEEEEKLAEIKYPSTLTSE
jgi:hypothetical protein